MDYQYAEAFSDLEIGDIVQIEGMVDNLYDIRMIQEIRDSRVYFQYRLQFSNWVTRDKVEVIRKVD